MAEKSSVPYDTISRMSVSSQSFFNKCCFCVPLRIGCFVLGYLNLVVNCYQTLALVAVTTFIGVSTHGFDHVDDGTILGAVSTSIRVELQNSDQPGELKGLDHEVLTTIGYILIILLIANLVWMIVNISCLVGLHKKRPGPIRVYVGFATARLLLAMAGFIYVVMSSNKAQPQSIVIYGFDLALSAYFILVYYIYAAQLEKEREAAIAQPAPVNNVFLYPTKLDKSHLVA